MPWCAVHSLFLNNIVHSGGLTYKYDVAHKSVVLREVAAPCLPCCATPPLEGDDVEEHDSDKLFGRDPLIERG